MKKYIAGIAIMMSTMIFIQCNNSGTAETSTDTTTIHADTSNLPIVTEGGLRDSLKTGATDTSKRKDSLKK